MAKGIGNPQSYREFLNRNKEPAMAGHHVITEGDASSSFFQVYQFADGVELLEISKVVYRIWPTGEWKQYEYAALSTQISACRNYKVLHGDSAWRRLGVLLGYPPF